MTALTHAYSGPGYPALPSERGGFFARMGEAELITGAFRVVEDEGARFVVGNGEDPEKFWKVDGDEWDARAQDYTADSPPFVEAIKNPVVRAALRRQVADMRVVARRCAEGEPPTREVDE